MPIINQIPFSEIKLVRRLREAEVGSIVQFPQIDGSAASMTGMVSAFAAPNGQKGVVILEGKEAGVFVGDQEVMQLPALDVSDLTHLAVVNPAPKANSAHIRFLAGDICLADGQSEKNVLTMAITWGDVPSVLSNVVLQGPNRGAIAGVIPSFYLGRAEVVPNVTSA